MKTVRNRLTWMFLLLLCVSGLEAQRTASPRAACAATPITPYLSVNGGSWQEVTSVTVAPGTDVYLAPWPLGGLWSWTGPNGFTSTANAINNIPLSAGANAYVAVYTDANGCTSTATFNITETGSGTATPASGVSLTSSASSLTLTQGTSGYSNLTLSGFSGGATLTASGLPSGVTATFGSNPATSSTLLTLAVSASAPVSTSTVTIMGVSGAQSAAASLVVSVAAAPGVQTTCNGGGTIAINNSAYIYQQNEWNSGLQQCASVNGPNVTMTTASFGLATNGPPADYSSVIYGCHSGGPCSSGSNLPIQVNALTVANTSVSFVQPSGYANNDAYDIWFDQQPSAGGLPNGTELMIWPNHQGPIQPYGSQVGNVTIHGVSYQVWTGFENQWNVITFLQAPTVNFVANLDLLPFIQYAETQYVNGAQVLQPSWYLVDIEFGWEIWDGGQGLQLNNFSAFASSAPQPVVPSILSITPAMGAPGTSVTITGTNFGSSQGGSDIRFGSVPAAVTSWSPTSITAIVPGMRIGASNLTVAVNSQTSNAVSFRVAGAASPGFTLAPASAAVTFPPGGTVTDAIQVTPAGGFSGPVTLSASGLPAGVTASFSTNPASTSSVLTLSAGSAVNASSATVTIQGTSGTLTASTSVALTVATTCAATPITPYISLNHGSWQPVNAVTVPAGTDVYLAPWPLGGKWSWTGPNGFTSTANAIDGIPLSVGQNLFYATYTDANGCSSKETFNITETAAAASGFTLASAAATASLPAGGTATSQISVLPGTGFTGSVVLSASGLPAGVTVSFSTNPATLSSVATFTASSTAAAGTFTVTIAGTSGTFTASTAIALTVSAATTGTSSYALAPSFPALALTQGSSGAETVSFSSSNGFSGVVTYAVSGLPPGVTSMFVTNPVKGNVASLNGVSTSSAYTGSTVLMLTAGTSAAAGTTVVTVTGTSGTATASTTFSLTIKPSAALPSGYWHTSGNQILDANNQAVRMASINWYGFEQGVAVPGGLLEQDYHTILQTIKNLGYNTIRIPYSNQMIETPAVPESIWTASINQDLAGLTNLQILDKIVAAAGNLGLHIVLDNHRSEAGDSAEANGLWYTTAYPESSWINDWTALAQRYAGSNTVIGMDLRDEPHAAQTGGSCWGCGTAANDWRLAAERAGNAIQAVNPNLLIFVEGTDCFNGDCDFWGGNLEGAASLPVVLNTANHLVYSPHDYGPNLYVQPWFNNATTAASLQATWNKYWGFLSTSNTAPIWIGEFGTTNAAADVQSATAGSQGQWFQSLVAWLQANPVVGWGYWAVNGEDTYALLDTNYDPSPASATKQAMFASIQAPSTPAAPGFSLGATASSITVAQASTGSTTINIGATNGFTGAVTLTASGLPAGVSASFATNPANASSTLTLSAASTAAAGTSTVTIHGVSGTLTSSTTLTLTITAAPAPGFSLAAAISGLALAQGQSTSDSISVTPRNGFSGPVTLVASGLPSGVTASFTANTLTGTQTLTLTATPSASPGTSTVTITGTSGSISSSTTVALTVTASGSSPVACHIGYSLTNSWAGGFSAAVTIYNTGTTALNNWTLTWTFANGQQISSLWNGNVAQSNGQVTVTSLSYNGSIPAGANYAAMGFNATLPGSANAVPVSFAVNGTACQ